MVAAFGMLRVLQYMFVYCIPLPAAYHRMEASRFFVICNVVVLTMCR